MKTYRFSGAVYAFGRYVCKWSASTTAISKEKAISNLKFRFRKQYGYGSNVPLLLDGTFA